MTKTFSTNEIRTLFLNYFKDNGHTIVPSSSLIPANDPTLLFTNAGMVQFKEVFLGLEQRSYTRATSSQRCVRAGGKHNDLENVGHTKRHHTFFEMLGNFSFGDYFKKEAITMAWKLITEVFEIPKERLWVSVFHDDKESEDIWLDEIKVDPKRFSRCGEKDNFWSMGETGPCGPCTEIFYDHGPDIPGGPPGSPEQEGDRYVEIWNLVFMQFNRDIEGKLSPLPKPCVDTGMGLERMAAVLQGAHDNYDIDLFQYLLKKLSKIVNCNDFTNSSMRVIVDHIRSCSFLIMDGVTPSNEGRGYVLRRIIRRAIRHGFKLGQKEPFFYRLTQALADIMGEAYPQLRESQPMIEQTLKQEELQFANTLEKGLKRLDQAISEISGNQLPGEVAFQLYDTYGFPLDLTADIASEKNLTIDYQGFEEAMARQRALSQQTHQFSMDQTEWVHVKGTTEFIGYESLTGEGKVTALLIDKKPVNELYQGQKGMVVLDRTPFYAESGGQIGDSGYLYFGDGVFRVHDTQRQGAVYLHFGEVLKGHLRIGDNIRAEVDESRQAIVLNHSATHLLHEALRRVLGPHVRQKGSLVEAKRLRFDFSHPKPLTEEEIQTIERMINQEIRANLPSTVTQTNIEEAKKMGALALFDEKYAEKIRVVKMGEFSMEVCGGTHVHRSGDIGFFKIISESACASGVRRIEAVTGDEALNFVEKEARQLREISSILKASPDKIASKITQLMDENRSLLKSLAEHKEQKAHQKTDTLLEQAVEIEGIKVLAANMGAVDRETLRKMLDKLKQKLDRAAIVLASVKDQQITLVAGVSKSCVDLVKATDLLNHVASQVGGKGGGRPDMAQGGGNQPEFLDKALQSVEEWMKKQVR